MFKAFTNIIRKKCYTFWYKGLFFIAIDSGNSDIFYNLLPDMNFNCTGDDGYPCLSSAVDSGRPDFVRAMLARGADVNVQVRHYIRGMPTETPLMIASQSGELDMVKLLLSYGADPYITHKRTKHALKEFNTFDYALLGGHPEIAEYIQSYLQAKTESELLTSDLALLSKTKISQSAIQYNHPSHSKKI